MTDTILIPETIVPGQRLGRHIRHDPASRAYVAEQASTIVSFTHAYVGLPLDQGDLGSCTASALCGALNTQPDAIAGGHVYSEADAVTIYERETADEGQPYPPNDPGGTGIDVSKAGKELGLLSGYTHTFDLQTALAAFVAAPGMIGINWYTSFDTPDANAVVSITPGATVRGGHEVLVFAVDAEKQLIGCMNSWGDWGPQHGVFWISWATLQQLLDEQGDVTIPVPASKPAPTPTPDPADLTLDIADPTISARIVLAAQRHELTPDAWATRHFEHYFREGITGAVDRLLEGD